MSSTILRYKYVPLDDSFKAPFDEKGSLSIIKDGTMKFTHPKDFNDPFDCYPEVDAKAYSKSQGENKGLMKRVRNERKLTPAQYIQQKPAILKQLEISCPSRNEKINNKVGICSLSRNPLNLLMWAHYASSHTGFVVEFSIPIEQTPSSGDDAINRFYTCLSPLSVIYKEEKPIINKRELFDEYFLTKGKDWEYEQEERVIDYYRKAGIHPYDRKRILKSVIAGMRMSDDNFAVLKNTVDQVNKELGINVTVHRAEPSKGKFALFVPDRDDLNIHND